MNSVALSRAKKRDAVPIGVVGAGGQVTPPQSASSATTTNSGSFRRGAIPSPPPPTQPLRTGSFGLRAAAPLPCIPSGAVAAAMSPKTKQYRSARGRNANSSDDDDVDRLLQAIDVGAADAPPFDGIDGLSAEEQLEAVQAFGARITAEQLRDITGFEDLHLVTSTELVVDTRKTLGVDHIGELMPRLVSLRLNHSRIPSFRDLGTRFSQLQVLQLNNAHVKSLGGIGACSALKELYAAFNVIVELEDLAAVGATLEVLDLEGNQVDAVEQVEVLSAMHHLKSLCLSGNPVELMWQARDHNGVSFREYVARSVVPHLVALDEVPLEALLATTATDKTASRFQDPMTADLASELMLLQASIRSNVNVEHGLEGAIESRHRHLYSRQSTSCGGARRRTAGSSQTPRATALTDARCAVNSAPTEGRSPKKISSSGTSGVPPATSAASASSSSIFSKNMLAAGRSKQEDHAASSLTSGHHMFSGNLVKSLRRRLPSLTGASVEGTQRQDAGIVDALSNVVPDRHRTPREHELIETLQKMKDAHDSGKEVSAEAAAALQQLLDELDLEFDIGDGDDDAVEALKRTEFLDAVAGDSKPEFLEKYKDMFRDEEQSKVETHKSENPSPLDDAEIIREVAKLKMRTLRDVTDSLVEHPQRYESLQMSDLGEYVDDVL